MWVFLELKTSAGKDFSELGLEQGFQEERLGREF